MYIKTRTVFQNNFPIPGGILNIYLIAILCLYIIKEAFEYAVQYINLRHIKNAGANIPPEVKGRIDGALLRKTQKYEAEKTGISIVSSIFGNIVTIIFIFGGVLDIYNSWIASLNLSFVVSGWLFFVLLGCAGEILSAPFSLYNTFKIENKYGFNTMTPGLWMADFIKTLLISAILLSFLLFAGLWLIQRSPGYWWLWVWGFLFAFSIFIMYISPYVIEPLFNKFTPVEDRQLRDRLTALTSKAGIHANKVLRMDASKRSRHSNAYFTGIGKTKRIVLYDTILESMNHNEILAVLAHEIGHWKKKHLLKTLAAFEVFSLIALYFASKVVQSGLLVKIFEIDSETLFAKFVILAFLAGIFSLPFKPLANFFLRRHERQADRYSYKLTKDADSMESALIKLSKENLSNLYPHPLYVAMHYSHPPVLERIRYLKGFSLKENNS